MPQDRGKYFNYGYHGRRKLLGVDDIVLSVATIKKKKQNSAATAPSMAELLRKSTAQHQYAQTWLRRAVNQRLTAKGHRPVHKTTISQWFREGSSLPADDKLPIIAEVIGQSADDLLAAKMESKRRQAQITLHEIGSDDEDLESEFPTALDTLHRQPLISRKRTRILIRHVTAMLENGDYLSAIVAILNAVGVR